MNAINFCLSTALLLLVTMATWATARPKLEPRIKKGGGAIQVLEKLFGPKELDAGAVATMQTPITLPGLEKSDFELSHQRNQGKRRVRRRCSSANPRCYRPTGYTPHKRVHKHMRMRKRKGRQH